MPRKKHVQSHKSARKYDSLRSLAKQCIYARYLYCMHRMSNVRSVRNMYSMSSVHSVHSMYRRFVVSNVQHIQHAAHVRRFRHYPNNKREREKVWLTSINRHLPTKTMVVRQPRMRKQRPSRKKKETHRWRYRCCDCSFSGSVLEMA